MGRSAQAHSGGRSYESLDTPTVWRDPRADAAARVQALEDKGVERFDIPAFLRRQAD
jgi:cell division protein FtsZ